LLSGVIKPHIVEDRSRKPVLISVGVHVVLLLFFTFGSMFLPRGEALQLGMGPGGGQGDFLSVGLAAELGGGAGMYKAPITPRPEAAPPQEKNVKRSSVEPEPEPEQPVFEKPTSKKTAAPAPRKTAPATPRLHRNEQAETARPGQIPRKSDPGKGPSGGGGGSGGGFGGGQGVSIGSGTGEGNVNSWYIRQVEQRVGQNWLLTSLGDTSNQLQVQTVASFVVTSSGRITDVEIEKESGIRSVDLAVMRAIQASNPLQPLPGEFRGKSVRFQAVFEYPPK
jgi:TonB family protein